MIKTGVLAGAPVFMYNGLLMKSTENVKKKNNEYIIAAKLYKTDKNTSITEKELEGSLILMK